MIFAANNGGYAQQDVTSVLDYAEDWSGFMALIPGDTINSSVWSSFPAGINFTQESIDNTDFYAVATISGGTPGTVYRVQNNIVTVGGRKDVRTFYLSIADVSAAQPLPLTTALFNRFTSIADFKASSLSFIDQSFPVDQITDDTIWENLVAAEADAQHQLRVYFQPTEMIPDSALQSEIDALVAAGTPYAIEDDYDFQPGIWNSAEWGYTLLRYSPVITIHSIKLSYPAPINTILDVPQQWIQLDAKYGHIRFVPAGTMMNFGPLTTFMMNTIAAGATVPGAMQVRYQTGLKNAKGDYPDLVNLVKRMAMLRILKSALLPQSSSISADGLSQSNSFDVLKLQQGVDDDLSKLQDVIKGVRLTVI